MGCGTVIPPVKTNPLGNTLMDRIPAPKGYEWIMEESGSFGNYLQHAQVQNDGSRILDYQGTPISNQNEHMAILNYDVGPRDLQQCADAVIRLRAEYLFQQKRFNDIRFHFTSGDEFSWNDYKNGIRAKVDQSNKVVFEKSAPTDSSYKNFRKYLDAVYMYAGTISLNKETNKVTNNKDIKSGDILVTPGSPGHAVIIVGRAKNKAGNIIYLIAEGYTPAQSIHVISNALSENNPWYSLDVTEHPTLTARYVFSETNIRTFG
jgi:hypothetical protein